MSFRGTGGSQTFDSLNAFILKGEPAQGLGLLYDSLLAASADEPDAAYGLVAESLEYPARPQLGDLQHAPRGALLRRRRRSPPRTWSSPTRPCSRRARPRYKIILKDIESVEALDPHRVKFTFKPGVATRDLPALAGGLAILPKHYYETVEFDQSTLEPPIGSGAYVVDAVQPGKTIRYCRSPDYWGKDLPVNVGSNNFDCYRLPVLRRQQCRVRGAEGRRLPVPPGILLDPLGHGLRLPGAREGLGQARGARTTTRPRAPRASGSTCAARSFQDPRVREAIALMFNFEWTNETLFYGLYKRTDSFFENSPMQAEGLPQGEELALLEEFRDQLPPEIFTEPA